MATEGRDAADAMRILESLGIDTEDKYVASFHLYWRRNHWMRLSVDFLVPKARETENVLETFYLLSVPDDDSDDEPVRKRGKGEQEP